MGIAEVIPGISGGTLALILGVYERLIKAIHSFNISLEWDITIISLSFFISFNIFIVISEEIWSREEVGSSRIIILEFL